MTRYLPFFLEYGCIYRVPNHERLNVRNLTVRRLFRSKAVRLVPAGDGDAAVHVRQDPQPADGTDSGTLRHCAEQGLRVRPYRGTACHQSLVIFKRISFVRLRQS